MQLRHRARAVASAKLGRSRGFTLIELMVTISLLGILLGLAAPAFSDWIRGARVRSVTDALQTGARLAQSEAVRLNRQMVFFLTNNSSCTAATSAVAGGTYWAIRTVPLVAGGPTPMVQCGTLADVAAGVAIAGPTAICFNSAGRQTSNPAPGAGGGAVCDITGAGTSTYDVTAANARALRVQVSLGGQVRQCDPARSATTSADGC